MNNFGYCENPYFVGKKVEVDIPLHDGQTFSDWAIINETDDNLISLQLSRDFLPYGVVLKVGQALTIRSEHDCLLHSSRCFIVSMGQEQKLLLRLTSGTLSGEMREYYRVDASLPIKYQSLNDQNPANVREQWEAKRKWRKDDLLARDSLRLEAKRRRLQEEESIRRLNLLDSSSSGEASGLPRDEEQDDLLYNQYDDLLVSAQTTDVTISGGGLKISSSQRFDPDELILLEIFVPSLRIIVDVVARVVFSSPAYNIREGQDCCNIGMQFVFIDESSRLAINSHIGSIQLKQIRHFKGFTTVKPLPIDKSSRSGENYAYIAGVDSSRDPGGWSQSNIFKMVAYGLIFSCAFAVIAFCVYDYIVKHPKSEIQLIFERGMPAREAGEERTTVDDQLNAPGPPTNIDQNR